MYIRKQGDVIGSYTCVCIYGILTTEGPAQIKDPARIIDRVSGGLEISRPYLNIRSGLLIELIVSTYVMYFAI